MSRPDVADLWDKYSFDPFKGRFHCRETDYLFRGNACNRSHQLSVSFQHRYPYGVCVFAWYTGRWPDDGMQIDHIDRNPFNHQVWNLREVTPAQNNANRGPYRKRKVQTKPTRTGVGTGRWRAAFKAPLV
jgi:hypothetical protein